MPYESRWLTHRRPDRPVTCTRSPSVILIAELLARTNIQQWAVPRTTTTAATPWRPSDALGTCVALRHGAVIREAPDNGASSQIVRACALPLLHVLEYRCISCECQMTKICECADAVENTVSMRWDRRSPNVPIDRTCSSLPLVVPCHVDSPSPPPPPPPPLRPPPRPLPRARVAPRRLPPRPRVERPEYPPPFCSLGQSLAQCPSSPHLKQPVVSCAS